jgi:hypothetical protein
MSHTLQEAMSQWRLAENRLYPVVTTRPDLYAQSISLVRAVADELGSSNTVEELLDAYERAPDIVATVVTRSNLATQEIDLGLIAGAAFNLRYGELLEETHRAEALRRIREGRRTGATWVTLYETGSPKHAPLVPYRRLEMLLNDGIGLHIFVEPDPDSGGPVFGFEAIQLDPRTGDWVRESKSLLERRTFSDAQLWEDGVQRAREHFQRG